MALTREQHQEMIAQIDRDKQTFAPVIEVDDAIGNQGILSTQELGSLVDKLIKVKITLARRTTVTIEAEAVLKQIVLLITMLSQ